MCDAQNKTKKSKKKSYISTGGAFLLVTSAIINFAYLTSCNRDGISPNPYLRLDTAEHDVTTRHIISGRHIITLDICLRQGVS